MQKQLKMKIALKQCSLILLLVSILSLDSKASDALIEKTKNYTKTYPLSGNDRVKLENQFGELRVQTWNRNEVKVDVVITGRSGTEERAQQIIENIEIQDGKSGGEVWFKTDIDKHNNHSNKKNNYKDEGFTINYLVSLAILCNLRCKQFFWTNDYS